MGRNGAQKPSRWQQGALVGVVVLAVVAGVMTVLPNAWNYDRVSGEVEAEDLSAQFIGDPCQTRKQYDDELWIITGTVIAPEPTGSRPEEWTDTGWFTLFGGVHEADGMMSDCTSNVPQTVAAGRHSEDLYLKWQTPLSTAPLAGETALVVCRVHVGKVGTFFSPGLSGSDCRYEND